MASGYEEDRKVFIFLLILYIVHTFCKSPSLYYPEVLIINKILIAFSYFYLRLNFVIVIGRYFHQVYSWLLLESSVIFCYLHSKCCSRICKTIKIQTLTSGIAFTKNLTLTNVHTRKHVQHIFKSFESLFYNKMYS